MKTMFSICEESNLKLDDILCDVEFIKKGKDKLYGNVASVFDIEASSFYKDNKKYATMYAWVFGLNGKCILGRTWDEFYDVIKRVIEYYELNVCKRLIIYVHNLSYEFQFIKERFEWYKVFCADDRQPIYAVTTDGIEFRCSYLLSGYKLETIGKNLTKYKVEKMVGDLNYDLLRHTNTPLTQKEWKYILNDGLVVMAHIQEEIERLGEITELPLTKTGYVRKLCHQNCLEGDDKTEYHKIMHTLTMNVDDYKQAKRTYCGGFTHANHNWVNKTLNDVSSYDFTSSYPAVMISEKFPMSKAKMIKLNDMDDFHKKLNTYCCMFECTFYNLRSIFDNEHYISRSRCHIAEEVILDNGRIVEGKKVMVSLTEIDYKIIEKMYDWNEIDICNFKIFQKGYLPKPFIETILKLYEDKTTLKGVDEKQAEYNESKEMLNACYGMSVTDPCKDEISFENINGWIKSQCDIETTIENYNKSYKRFLYYFWGIWITAYARRNLFTGIFEFKDDYIYSDTDSLKVFNKDRHQNYIDNYNKTIEEKVNNCLSYYGIDISRARPKTIKGIEKPIGFWDYEGTYKNFKTLGAKRYIYADDELHITIAGVKKKNGSEFLKYKYKNINNIFKNFNEGLVFPKTYFNEETKEELNGSGKLTHTYIDEYYSEYVTDYLGNTTICSEYSYVHLEKAEYCLSLDVEFKNYLLRGCKA